MNIQLLDGTVWDKQELLEKMNDDSFTTGIYRELH